MSVCPESPYISGDGSGTNIEQGIVRPEVEIDQVGDIDVHPGIDTKPGSSERGNGYLFSTVDLFIMMQ